MIVHIETERLILREVRDEDLEGMFELDSDPKVHQYLGMKPITTMEQAQKNLDFIRRQYDERGIGRFTAIEKATGEFIGWSGLKLNSGDAEELGPYRDFYDVGYRFIPRYWGKGYATESAIASLEYGFETMNLPTIYGAAETENIGSNKVLMKIGLNYVEQFPYEDVMINWYEKHKP